MRTQAVIWYLVSPMDIYKLRDTILAYLAPIVCIYIYTGDIYIYIHLKNVLKTLRRVIVASIIEQLIILILEMCS